tara:strand:- start:599 stop:8548 length:7950 start_codon:yes stop_codon:yes gene_type:complete
MAISEEELKRRLGVGGERLQPSDERDLATAVGGERIKTSEPQPKQISGVIDALTAGIHSGTANVRAQNKNFRAAIETLRGNDIAAANFLQEGDMFEAESGNYLQGMESFDTFLDEPTADRFFMQVASATGQFIPSLAASLTEAVIVGGVVTGATILSGGTLTPAVLGTYGAARATGGQALKALPQRLAAAGYRKDQAEDLIEKAYKNAVAKSKGVALPHRIGQKQIKKYGMSQQEILDNVLYPALKSQLKGKRFKQGALLGAFGQEQRIGTGIAFSDYADQGPVGVSNARAIDSILQGSVFGAIGVGAEATVAGTLLNQLRKGGRRTLTAKDPFKFKRAAGSSFFKDLGTISLTTALSEGVAEGLQEELSVQQKFMIDENYTKANARVDRLNALFAGFFGGVGVGGGLGTATGVTNKVRELTNRAIDFNKLEAEYEERLGQAQRGRVFKERGKAIEAQFETMFNSKSNKDSVFVDIDSESEYKKVQRKLEEKYGNRNLYSVATPTGAYFTTQQLKAEAFANIMDADPFNTDMRENWLASEGLKYTRGRKDGDDMVVGILDTQTGELVHYQTTESLVKEENGKTGFENAKALMKQIRGKLDPNRYIIVDQTLNEHLEYRKKGIEVNETTGFDRETESPQMFAFQQRDENQRAAEDEDLSDVEMEGGTERAASEEIAQTDRVTTAADILAGKILGEGKIKQTKDEELQEQGLDTYLKEIGLNITYRELIQFTRANNKIAPAAQQAKIDESKGKKLSLKDLEAAFKPTGKEIQKIRSEVLTKKENTSYTKILSKLIRAPQNQVLNSTQRQMLESMQTDSVGTSAEVLTNIAEIIENLAPVGSRDSIQDSLAGQTQDPKKFKMVPKAEILRTSVIPKPRRNQFSSKKEFDEALKEYKEQSAETRAKVRPGETAVKDEPILKGQTGTIQNPYLDPVTGKPFKIREKDKKAEQKDLDAATAVINENFLATFNKSKQFYSRSLIQNFLARQKTLQENTQNTGFIGIVDTANIPDLIKAAELGITLEQYREVTAEKSPTTQDSPTETVGESVNKVISGGQTGADIIFSQAAKEAGLETGGLMPTGFVTEDGKKPNYAKEFNMQQDPDTGKGRDFYLSRTRKNVANSDGTIVVVNDPKNMSSGSKATVEFAKELNKPVLVVKPTVNAATIRNFIDKNKIKVLNGAGSRGSTLKNQNKLKTTLTEVFTNKVQAKPKKPKKPLTPNREYVLVEFGPEQEQALQYLGTAPSRFRDIGNDVRVLVQQAKNRHKNKPALVKAEKKDRFKIRMPEVKSTRPGGTVDISVILEGFTTIAKQKGIRDFNELEDGEAQRVAAFNDFIVYATENNILVQYFPPLSEQELADPDTLTERSAVDIDKNQGGRILAGSPDPRKNFSNYRLPGNTTVVGQPDLNKAVLEIFDDPNSGVLRTNIENFSKAQINKAFGTSGSANALIDNRNKLIGLDTPLRKLIPTRSIKGPMGGTVILKGENFFDKALAPHLEKSGFDITSDTDNDGNKVYEGLTDFAEMDYSELEEFIQILENFVDLKFAPKRLQSTNLLVPPRSDIRFARDQEQGITESEDKSVKFVGRGISAANLMAYSVLRAAISIRNAIDKQAVRERITQYDVNSVLYGRQIGIFADNLAILEESRQMENGDFRSDTGEFVTSIDQGDPNLTSRRASEDASLRDEGRTFNETKIPFVEEQAKILGQTPKVRYPDGNKDKTKADLEFIKYGRQTINNIYELASMLGFSSSVPTRAKRAFRKQITNNIIAAARKLGLSTNLVILDAEPELSGPINFDKLNIEETTFNEMRSKLLFQSSRDAITIKYPSRDVILIKGSTNLSDGQYFDALLKELGNSFIFQELDFSLKVGATRKALLKEYNKVRKNKNAPAIYSDSERGFNNWMADQFSIALKKELNIPIGDTDTTLKNYESMNGATKGWFKRLVKNLIALYKTIGPKQRFRYQSNETAQSYIEQVGTDIRDGKKVHNRIPWQVKAKIENKIESILGPQTFTDKQLTKALEQVRKIFSGKNMPKWLRQILLTADTRLRHFSEALADFFQLDPRTKSASGMAGLFTLKNARAQRYLTDIARILGVKDGFFYSRFTEEQRTILNEAAREKTPTAQLSPKAKQIRLYLEKLYNELDLKQYGVDKRKNFFPRVIAIHEIAGDAQRQAALRELLIEYNPGEPVSEIDNAIAELVRKGNGDIEFTAQDEIEVGVMQKRKKLFKQIPNDEFMDRNLMDEPEVSIKKYMDKLALKIEFERKGGTTELNKLLEPLTKAEQEEARKIIDSMFGKIPPITNGFLKAANNIGLVLNIVTLLGMTVIASLQDTAGPILRSRGTNKITDIADVIKDMIKNPTEAADIARDIGAIGTDAMSSFFIFAGETNFLNNTSKNIADWWFRVTGLEAYTRFTRVFATGMAQKFLSNHAQKAKAGDQTSIGYLQELNVTADEILAWEKGKATEAQLQSVNEALIQFVDESIVRPNPAQRPTYANDPRYALIWQLKSFFYAYGKTIVFPTLKETHRNFMEGKNAGAAIMPMVIMASMLIPITMLGWEIRERFKVSLAWALPGVSPDDPGVDYYRTDSMTPGQYWTEVLDRSGMLGPASLAMPIFLESHRYGKPFWVPPLGPTAERLYDGVNWDWRAADFMPIYSQLDTRALGR